MLNYLSSTSTWESWGDRTWTCICMIITAIIQLNRQILNRPSYWHFQTRAVSVFTAYCDINSSYCSYWVMDSSLYCKCSLLNYNYFIRIRMRVQCTYMVQTVATSCSDRTSQGSVNRQIIFCNKAHEINQKIIKILFPVMILMTD